MNKYLLDILKIENTVIIPGIGAIMVTNNKTGTFMFNPHLKFNDKTLEKYVEQNSNMDAQESANFVAKYTREILAELDKGEAYTIFGLGKFLKNGDDIEMIFDASSAPKEEKKATTIIPTPVEKTETPKEKKEEPIKTKAPLPTLEKTKEEKPKENKKVATPVDSKEKKEAVVTPPINNPFDEKKPAASNSFKEVQKEKVTVTEKKEEAPIKKVTPPIVPATTDEKKAALEKAGITPKKSMEKTKKDKKPKKKGKIVWLILLLLLIGSGVYIGINWDVYQVRLGLNDKNPAELNTDDSNTKDANKVKEDPIDKEETIDESSDSADSLAENSTGISPEENINDLETEEAPVEETPIEEAPVKVVETTESFESNGSSGGNGDYHVVVGLFSNPSNAQGLVAKLKAEGHNGMILGTFDNLQMVVVKSFPTREASIEAMREIRASIEDRAWVFRY
jgi:hypothetical protein